MTTIKNIRARNAETLAKVRAANAPGADSAYYQAEMDQLKATKTAPSAAADTYMDAELAQLKATKTPVAEAVEGDDSVRARFERLYADYLHAGDNLLAEVHASGWVRTTAALLCSVAIGIGAAMLGTWLVDMFIAATLGASATGLIPIVITIVGFTLAAIASLFASRVACSAVLGEYDDVVITKAKAAKSWVTSLFDRRVIVLGGA